ncbi:MAG: BMP family ABC transporter substrate-binding protein [Chloroflexi bacterium]|nr:BMP family ABC transporter substrate-binding protein [Chloroflexota bacterium]
MSSPISSVRMKRRPLLAAMAIAPLAGAIARAPAVHAQDPLVVTMVTDTAGLGDQNFNDLAKRGLDQAVAELGVQGEVIESRDAASYIPNLTQSAEQSDLTVGVGFLLTEAITEVANQYPDDNFLLIDAVSEAPNVQGVLFREQEGAFLSGVLAGLMTESNQLGVVGGIKIPPVVRYAVGFEAGARSVNPDVEVVVAYADTFSDPALGKELTLAQYNQGVDIAFPVAGLTGVGSFDAAKELGEGYWVIAADTDQSQLGAEHQLAVSEKGVDTALFQAAQQVVEGTFEGGEQSLGLAEDGVGLGNPHESVPQEVLDIVAAYEQAIIDGTITVPSNEEELAAFEPVPIDAIATPVATPSA